eukprot:Selendium_serpulae@DN6108_c5_g1_i1.p1
MAIDDWRPREGVGDEQHGNSKHTQKTDGPTDHASRQSVSEARQSVSQSVNRSDGRSAVVDSAAVCASVDQKVARPGGAASVARPRRVAILRSTTIPLCRSRNTLQSLFAQIGIN